MVRCGAGGNRRLNVFFFCGNEGLKYSHLSCVIIGEFFESSLRVLLMCA